MARYFATVPTGKKWQWLKTIWNGFFRSKKIRGIVKLLFFERDCLTRLRLAVGGMDV
jgi:hypothetical protein